MRLSFNLQDENRRSPLFKAKIPITVFNQPFTSTVSANLNTPQDPSFSLSTNYSSGPSVRLSYSASTTTVSPFSLSLKSGLGLSGSPRNSPLIFSAHFSLSPTNPSTITPAFSIHFKPQFGHFSLLKTTSSNPSPNPKPKPKPNSGYHSIPEAKSDSGSCSNCQFGEGFVRDGWQESIIDFVVRRPCSLNMDVAMAELDGLFGASTKLIIDTDPGIDDSVAILMAFQTPDLEVLGLTTIFGNVTTEDATRNALLLCEIAGHPGVPVAEGSPEPLKGGRPCVADFVHGSDGLGNISLPSPRAKKSEKSASEFLTEKISEYPGEVSILALGPLTNLALAIKRDSSFASKVKKIVVLGGAFFALGNVNPAAEANIYGDPEAADVVFTSGANIVVVGINITAQVKLTDDDLLELRQSKGKYAQLLSDMCKFYRDWHVKSDGVHGIFLHDPVSFAALVRPDLFTYKKGVVRVETQGICAGHTLMDQGLGNWHVSNPWTGYSPLSVAWTVDVDGVLDYIRKLLMKA